MNIFLKIELLLVAVASEDRVCVKTENVFDESNRVYCYQYKNALIQAGCV